MRSICRLSVRLGGNLPSLEELTSSLRVWASSYTRRAVEVLGGRDCWTAELAPEERGQPTPEAIAKAMATLRRMQPGILQLGRTRCRGELYVIAIRSEAETSLWFPPELVEMVAACQLGWSVSMPCGIERMLPSAEQLEVFTAPPGTTAREELRNHYSFRLYVRGTQSLARGVATRLEGYIASGPHWRGPADPTALAQGDDQWAFEITRPEIWMNGIPGVSTIDSVLGALEALGHLNGDAELRIDCLCVQEFGGIELPAELIAAMAADGLALGLSMHCLDCGRDEDEDDEDD